MIQHKQADFRLEEGEINPIVKRKKRSKVRKMIGLFLSMFLMAGYVGGAFYFSNRFFFNTQVNGVDFSRQTTSDARAFVESKAADFYMTIFQEGGLTEHIYASEMDLRFVASETIEGLLAAQNPFSWPLSLINSQGIDAQFDLFFDETLLKTRISTLDLVTEGQTFPVSADVIVEGTEAVMVPHQYGNVVDVDVLQKLLEEQVTLLAPALNVTTADIFIQPELTTQSPPIVEAFERVNRYLSTEITYLVGREVVVDRSLIANWVTIDEAFNVHLDEGQVWAWLDGFIQTVNTGSTHISGGAVRHFTGHDGRNLTVQGGFFGWIVNRDLEFAELIQNIRNGAVIEREPIYFQRGITHGETDWGNTFLQVDLTNQEMWGIVDGQVVFESPIVTGRPVTYNTTQGVYSILEMERNSTLISPWLDEDGEPTYEVVVDYWMRTTWSGYGFHDAIWQPYFGGQQYQRTGSHGCINLPLQAARDLFNLIHIGMPVVIHY
ncbi:MAG: L,D-transpeptidase/peptidoglycan binding protein [Defluviitaleaceae bacterium]|nr:L,D-transpeptidase/peptidoglycan binding protein [Defluviitaleaceae bacterium]